MSPPDGTLAKPKSSAAEAASKTAVTEDDRIEIVKRVVQAWEDAGVDVNCELCGCPDWSLVATDDSDGLAVPLRCGSATDLRQSFLTYALQCQRCANLRLFGKQRIDEIGGGADE